MAEFKYVGPEPREYPQNGGLVTAGDVREFDVQPDYRWVPVDSDGKPVEAPAAPAAPVEAPAPVEVPAEPVVVPAEPVTAIPAPVEAPAPVAAENEKSN